MALLFTVNTKAEDGGMEEIINKVGIKDEVKAWITGVGAQDLQCVTSFDFLSLWSDKHWEDGIKTKLKAAHLHGLPEGPALDIQTSRLRQIYRVMKHNFVIAESAAVSNKGANPLTESQLEAALDEETAKNLKDAWDASYGVIVPAVLSAADTLIGRTHREWRDGKATVPEVSKCRSQAHSVMPPTTEKVQIDHKHYFASSEPPSVKITSVIDYYFALRTLSHAWAFVGNFSVEFDGKKERFMHLQDAQGYADAVLRWTAESGVPDAGKLNWMKRNDVATRTKMMEHMRQGDSAGVALKKAIEFCKNDWHPIRRERDEQTARSRSRSRARKPKGSGKGKGGGSPRRSEGGHGRAVTTGPGDKRLCSRYNVGKCKNESQCPSQAWHLCNWQTPNGKACMAKHVRVHSH